MVITLASLARGKDLATYQTGQTPLGLENGEQQALQGPYRLQHTYTSSFGRLLELTFVQDGPHPEPKKYHAFVKGGEQDTIQVFEGDPRLLWIWNA